VISSRRQLWSVGAYLGMVVRDVFGVSTTQDGITVQPFVTAKLRAGAFAGSDSASLDNLRLQGRTVNVTLRLPAAAPAGTTGYYEVERILLDGKPVSRAIAWTQLKDGSRIEVVLGRLVAGESAIRRVNANPYEETPSVFGPREPQVASLARTGRDNVVTVTGAAGDAGVTYNVYRDGRLVASKLPAGAWTDRGASATACYAAEAVFTGSGNYSHHGRPRCVDAGVSIAATDPRVASNVPLAGPNARFAEPHLAGWGKPDDRFTVNDVRVKENGEYAVQVRYHNGANQINLGISGGVKWLSLVDAAGKTVAGGVIQLPHARIDKANTPAVFSTPLTARLKAGVSYRIQMSDFYNMSYLQSNSTFSAAGGIDGPSNRFDIYGVRLLRTR
jgi:hypothetical protein